MNGRCRFFRGQMLVLFTLALPALLGVIGLGADVGVLYFNWVQLQKAADSAALAGAQYLANPAPSPEAAPTPGAGCTTGGSQVTDAKSAACTYATYNGALASEFTPYVPAPNPPASVPAGVQTIQVVLNRPKVPTYFLHLVGLSSLAVKAQAIAMAPTAICGAGNGMLPVGVPNILPGYTNWRAAVGATLYLTEGTTPQAAGNWEWLSIPNDYVAPTTPTTTPAGGTSQLASTITTGCVDCQVNINDWVTPQTGNSGNSNPITDAIDTRISAPVSGVTMGTCNHSSCTNSGPPSPLPASAQQLVTLPVVDWSTANGGSNPVQVDGFVTAWLEGYSTTQGVTTLRVVVTGTPANTQVSSGNCSPTYPGLTQAELVQ